MEDPDYVPRWEHIHPDCPNTHGAAMLVVPTATSKSKRVLVIGGGDLRKAPHLNVSVFDIGSANWKQTYINSYGAPNRLFPQAFSVNNKGYVLGGYVDTSDGPVLPDSKRGISELTEITTSPFGLELRTVSTNALFSRYGHTACVVGPKMNRVCILGGKALPPSSLLSQTPPLFVPPVITIQSERAVSPVPTETGKAKGKTAPPAPATPAGTTAVDDPPNASSNIFLLSFDGDVPTLVGIETEGDGPIQATSTAPNTVPISREFHSATVCGQHNQYVLVFGGKTGSTLHCDLYLLDLSACLNITADDGLSAAAGKAGAKPVEKGGAKGKDAKKGGGGAPSGPVAVWYKLIDASKVLSSRYLHCAISYADPTAKSRCLCIFGGKGVRSNLPITVDAETGVANNVLSKFHSDTRYLINIDDILDAVSQGNKTFNNLEFQEICVSTDTSAWTEKVRAENPLLCTESVQECVSVLLHDTSTGADALSANASPIGLLACGGYEYVNAVDPHELAARVSASLRMLVLVKDSSSEMLNSLRRSVKLGGFYQLADEVEGMMKFVEVVPYVVLFRCIRRV
jgi:hypothetical protein